MTVDDILRARLHTRDDIAGSEWRLWEYKTFNLHRGVLHWLPAGEPAIGSPLAERVREQVEARFRVSWWRGFGFGVIVESAAIPQDLTAIEASIDIRANGKGTWQWTVFVCPPSRIAIGVHTWVEGFLTSTYRQLIDHYQGSGYTVTSARKEKDGVMRVLTAAASLKGIRFREFEP